ncbi:TetR/AcrR family transcriptional regulator [Arthrobacter cryoconiti]|uniref:TetR/AcrR family transcriptional regulator n=1 Tax=Arthrobacter cryoconiti TaxID=748907 RepID=A0ABV8R300_9MICC|nr:TetR/AcrR family transcriptional regulator [Arthrobacter cryoconiti]MCC9068655.1 TetR/AcrR family transcriptional regulator; helix-turn-helix transcriptional regulator [Arthrobacter cryoconiti]
MSPDSTKPAPNVARYALELFARQGFEATSVDQIAAAAGISRSTFFRQFGSKEDVIFADHAALLEDARTLLASSSADPWQVVCQAAELVFAHFAAEDSLAAQRYSVVNAHPALRDKELVTVFRYEKLFDAHLRSRVPGIKPLESVRFAAAVIATHNYLLREFMRGARAVTALQVSLELDAVRQLFGVLNPAPAAVRSENQTDDVVVAVFSRSTPAAEIAAAVQRTLENSSPTF